VPRTLLGIFAAGLATGFALASAAPASASDVGAVKCGANQDRVWVYESLNSFDVETRLKCGETVEILSRVKGYVKIRTASGTEGYVPDAVFPDLPALPPDDADKPIASVAVAARAAVRPAVATASVAPPPMSATTAAPPSAAPASPTLAPNPAHNVAAKPAIPTVTSAVAPANSPDSVDVKPASAVAASPRVRPHEKWNPPTVVAEPPAPKDAPAKPAPPAARTMKASAIAPARQPSISSPAIVPAKVSVAAGTAAMMDTSAKASPSPDLTIVEHARPDADLEDYPDSKPENESADPACHSFFSAYGLAPAQYKWLVENRRKQYAGICPAPDLSRVDYVIIFAHDSDSYNDAMPALVHTDRNGFSDFSPLTTVDTALLSASALDKARYEFVWVFHTKRGTFDPAKFSARRRPQFTTDAKGSHASARAVEDAFHFIEGQGSPDR
jgi:hypothetical protein